MKKEKGLYVMNTEKGAFLKTAEFDNELTFESGFDQVICNAQPIAAVKIDNDFSEHNKIFATKLAEFLSQRGDKIIEKAEQESLGESELAKLLGFLAQ